MGIGPFGRHSSSRTCNCSPQVNFPNPNPDRFEIKEIHQIEKFVVAKIHYPDATNFEGNKILVFKDVDKSEIMKLKSLDPHFSSSKFAPIARFVPTEEGKMMAIKFCMYVG